MSNLSMLPLARLKELFNLESLIETGTEQGHGVNTALKAGFKNVYSCEIIESRYLAAQAKYKINEQVFLFHGYSKDMLPIILDLNKDNNILFWLDAHLPNCHDPKTDYKIDDILPLVDELKIIKKHAVHDCSEDVICIDDLCLLNAKFRDKNFDLQKWTHNKGERDISINWLKELLPGHIWCIDERSEGVLIGLPIIDSQTYLKLAAEYKWYKI